MPVTNVITTPFNVTLNDYFLAVDVPGPSSLILPIALVGTTFVFKDVSGDASTNPITITPSGGFSIDGNISYIIDSDFGSITLVRNTLEWNVT